MKVKKYIASFFEDSLLRNALYLVANSVLGSLAGFIFWLIAARYYSAENVGLASTIISVSGLLALFSNLGFSISLIRFLSSSKDKAKSLINSCTNVSVSVAIILSLIYTVFIENLSPELSFIQKDMIYIIVFMLFTVLATVSSLQDSIFVAYRRGDLSFIKMTLLSFIKIPIMYVVMTFGSLGIVLSYGTAYFIAVLIALFILIPNINKKYTINFNVDWSIIKKISNYSAGNYISWIFETLPNYILPILITGMLGAEMTAYFYMAWMIAGIIFIIPKSVATSLLAEGAHKEISLKQNIIKSLRSTFKIIIPGIFGIFLFGDKILMLFGNEYSANATELLLLLSISSVPMVYNNVYISINRVKKNVTSIIIINILINVGTLLIGYSTVHRYGILGIGLGWTLSQFIVSLYTFTQINIKYRFNYLDSHVQTS